jgi:hypothetical protein
MVGALTTLSLHTHRFERVSSLARSLAPRFAKEKIICITLHVRLSPKPQYESLSYEWGPKESLAHIFKTGK